MNHQDLFRGGINDVKDLFLIRPSLLIFTVLTTFRRSLFHIIQTALAVCTLLTNPSEGFKRVNNTLLTATEGKHRTHTSYEMYMVYAA